MNAFGIVQCIDYIAYNAFGIVVKRMNNLWMSSNCGHYECFVMVKIWLQG